MEKSNNITQEVLSYLNLRCLPVKLHDIYKYMDAQTKKDRHTIRGTIRSLYQADKLIHVKRSVWQTKGVETWDEVFKRQHNQKLQITV